MARKLEEACQASKDLERCLSDQEAGASLSRSAIFEVSSFLQVTHKVLQDEAQFCLE